VSVDKAFANWGCGPHNSIARAKEEPGGYNAVEPLLVVVVTDVVAVVVVVVVLMVVDEEAEACVLFVATEDVLGNVQDGELTAVSSFLFFRSSSIWFLMCSARRARDSVESEGTRDVVGSCAFSTEEQSFPSPCTLPTDEEHRS
jgi:hypothetical protein